MDTTITNFTSTPNTVFDIGGDSYRVETAGQSYSLTNPDAQTLRFEIQPGDKAWYDYTDGEATDRADIDGSANRNAVIPAGTPINLNYQFMLEPNGPNGSFTNTASWFVTEQMSNADWVTGVVTSPPFAIQLDSDHLQVVARYVSPGGNPSNSSSDLHMMTLWTDPNPITTDQYSNISIQCNVSNTGGGYLYVSINGNQVVNYNGPLGYGEPTYWGEGLYRSPTSETVAADFRNLTLTTGSAATSSGSGDTVTGANVTASSAATTPVSTAPTTPTTPVSTDPTTPASTAPTTPVSTDPTTPVSTAPTTPTTPVSTDPTTPASTPDSAHWFSHHPDFAPVATTLSDAGASKSAANVGTAADPVGSAGAKSFALFNQMMAGDFDGDSHFAPAAMASSSGSPQQSPHSLTRPLH